ncbi:regulatory protein, luxR family [Arthrobacter sp. cf158]|uniref:LuxR C-terminal-related transcriptional regulator n=1 Tax=Arthrobacter sp. cf158 TaxID=1761744 RepID=UPI00089A91F3|nr:LuxR C-terminal-related transcriptional regulator [Arthrobacter sp. cf158]SDX02378.1 regulatory protein, luxR family [Arthrobacter sp. cf158]
MNSVLDYVAKGLGVRIVGAPGSGRSTLLKNVVAKLEEDGATVYTMFAAPALAAVPFAGILSLGLDLRSRTIGILGIVDLLSVQMARTGVHLIAIDDLENLDRESSAVVDVLRSRSNVPLITTMNDRPFQAKSSGHLVSIPEATVSLTPLGYEQISKLIMNTLGHPADVNVVAGILNKSGGNLRLAVRIIETSVLSERLILKDGRWCMNGTKLMNEHLHGTVEALLQGLRPEEVRALNKMSLLGPSPVDRLVAAVGEEVLDTLEYNGLISVIEGPDHNLLAAVFPPIVDDYLRAHTLSSRRILQSAVTDHVVEEPGDHHVQAADDLLSASMVVLRAEMGSNHAAATRYFQQRLHSLEEQHYQAWERDRSLSNAVAVLSVYWGAPTNPHRIQEVLRRTDSDRGETTDLFFFTMSLAWWQFSREKNLPGAIATMHALSSSQPGLRHEAEAFLMFLATSNGRISSHQDQQLPDPTVQGPDGSIIPAVRGLLELYRLNPQGALGALDSAVGTGNCRRFDSFIRGMAMLSSGREEEALVMALDCREKALQDVDQFAFVSQSYIAALSLLHHGLFDEAEYLMGRAFSLGKPGFLVDSLHSAMLRLSSLRDAVPRSALGATSEAHGRDIGPVPGIGTGLHDLAASRPASAKAFDERASRSIERSLQHGFIFEAMHTGLFALGLLPGPRIRGLVGKILEDRGITVHHQLLTIADAAIEMDLPRLRHLLDTYVLDGDTFQVSMVLRGAEQRCQLSGEPGAAAEIRRAAKDFTARFRMAGTLLNFRSEPPGSSLTLREIEVALVAGQQSNQDIAEQFGISIRTVESHISNALRKTDTTTRKQLADLIRNAPKPMASGSPGVSPTSA